MDLLHIFPHLNATLNATSGLFLLIGFYFIRTKQVARHHTCMLTAASVSAVFLVTYLTHHAIRTYYFGLGPTRFTGEGLARPVYFTILTSHTILAAMVTPFVLLTQSRPRSPAWSSRGPAPSGDSSTPPDEHRARTMTLSAIALNRRRRMAES